MDDSNLQDRTETAASTPSSQHAAHGSIKPNKDRNCPFCGQAFTSSSLGRHLDLYIKPKNSKPPDGIHDVAEIRKIRGGITRRQPKTSLKTSSSNGNADQSHEGTPTAPSASRAEMNVDSRRDERDATNSPINQKDGDTMRFKFNAPSWQSTGVINNLPPRPPSQNREAARSGQAQRIQEMRRDTAGRKVQRPDYDNDSMAKLQEEAEVGRAAELALREVLSSLEAATKRDEPTVPFPNVDFFSLSFPGLCLATLPAPTTLLTATPFACGDSWSLAPPGRQQFETLNRLMQQRFRELRQSNPTASIETMQFKYNAFLQSAYEHWERLSEDERSSAWTLETLRAYATAADDRSQLRQTLEACQTRVRHLELEYDRLSRCQLPREYLLYPSNTVPAPTAALRQVQASQFQSGVTETDYDVDALLSKWRTAVQATKRRPRINTTSTATTPTTATYTDAQYDSPSNVRKDMIMNGSIWAVNGTMPRSAQGNVFCDDAEQPQHQYYTPPNPGAVVDDLDADAEAEGDGNGIEARETALALTKVAGDSAEVLTGNGKRSHPPTDAAEGRHRGPKMYKAQWYQGGETP